MLKKPIDTSPCNHSASSLSLLIFVMAGFVSSNSPAQVPNTRSSAKPLLGSEQINPASDQKIPAHFANAEEAMDGYCPVTILANRKWVKGDPQFAVILDGKKYLLADKERQQTFLQNTTKYAPALSGDCVVSFASDQSRLAGNLNIAAVHKGRLFFFHNVDQKRVFMADPTKFEKVDLAFQGFCVVSFIEEQKRVQGKEEFGTIVGGMRYYFADQGHRKKFLVDKARYVVPIMQMSRAQTDR